VVGQDHIKSLEEMLQNQETRTVPPYYNYVLKVKLP